MQGASHMRIPMIKVRYWLVICLMLLLVNLAWIWRIDQNGKEYSQRINDSQNRYMQVNRELHLMKRGWDYSMRSNAQALPEGLKVDSGKGTGSYLSDQIGRGRKLILVLSDQHCSTCIDQLLFLVRNEIPAEQRHDVLILYSVSESAENHWDHRKKILTGVEFLKMEDSGLGLPMDSLGIPYFFITGPEHLAMMTHAPYPTLENQTKDYIKLMTHRYLTNKLYENNNP